jgi:CheY-like chemotaxis protein
MRRKRRTPSQESLQKDTILVADCNEEFLRLLALSLTDAGFRVYCASTGEKALQVAKAYSATIDVLIADAQLLTGGEASQSMTGIELARQICAQRPNIKVVLMSEANLGTLVRGQGWEFIDKPLEMEAVKQKVDFLLMSTP